VGVWCVGAPVREPTPVGRSAAISLSTIKDFFRAGAGPAPRGGWPPQSRSRVRWAGRGTRHRSTNRWAGFEVFPLGDGAVLKCRIQSPPRRSSDPRGSPLIDLARQPRRPSSTQGVIVAAILAGVSIAIFEPAFYIARKNQHVLMQQISVLGLVTLGQFARAARGGDRPVGSAL